MSNSVYVWDKFIRVFHWSLVLLFGVCYLTGDDDSWLHVYSGYTILALVLLRIIWGIIGSKHAQFKDFIFSPTSIMRYTKSIFSGHAEHFLGHNPLGGLMVVALLVTLLTASLSGLKLYALETGKGPFAGAPTISLVGVAYADSDDDHEKHEDEGEDFWEDIHEASVNLMILLIVLHIAGVAWSSRMHHESLVKAMISGYKKRQ